MTFLSLLLLLTSPNVVVPLEIDVDNLPPVVAVANVGPSLVSVEIIETKYGISLSGALTRVIGTTGFSGALITPDGYVVTTASNLEGVRRIAISLEGNRWPARLVDRDTFNNIGLIKITGDAPFFNPIGVADSDLLSQGMSVLAVGKPIGEELAASLGVVSAIRDYFLPSGYLIPKMIQTDAHAFSFNRGGPLVDMDGKMVGMTAFSVQENTSTPVYLATSVLDLNFALPSNLVIDTAEKMMQGQTLFHPWIGIQPTILQERYALFAGIPDAYMGRSGILVQTVDANSPASQQGLGAGDILLGLRRTRVMATGREENSEEFVVSPLGLASWIRASEPKDTLTLILLREGQVEEVSLRPQDRPDNALPGTV
ncbi:serine protease [bacterium]|nr:serine protease [bacterium]